MDTYLTYSELIKLPTLVQRYNYLRLGGTVGEETFGFNRYANQQLYKSYEWKQFRDAIILRDNGCDLALEPYYIGGFNSRWHGKIYIHHLNPLTMDDIINRSDKIFDPENVVCASFNTHQAIHFGDIRMLPSDPVIRKPNDQSPWKTDLMRGENNG